MRITLSDGSSWPDPTNKETGSAMWRLIHSENHTKADIFRVIAMAEAYEHIITHPAMTLKKVCESVSEVRKVINANKKTP